MKEEKFFKIEVDEPTGEEVYNQFAKNMAKAIDIDIANTPLVDLLTTYTNYRTLQHKYEQLETNWKELKKWLEENLNELKQNDVYDRTSYETGQVIAIESVIAKMEEIECGNNDR